MAPDKPVWTFDSLARLQAASTSLLIGFTLFTFGSFFIWIGIGWSFAGFLWLIGSIFCIIGIHRMRVIFEELGKGASASSSSPVQVKSVERMKVEPPRDVWKQATVNRTERVIKTPDASALKPAMQVDWEEWVGKKLMQKAGIIIVLIGMIVFLKYSFDNRWIEELGRIVMSAIAAGAMMAAGEIFHAKYGKWAQAFTGGGLALLYFTVWAAHVLYAEALATKYGIVLPSSFALVLYSGITLVGALASIRYKSVTIAWFTVLGGYLTPLLVEAPQGSQLMLILYLAILTGGLLLLAWHQRWKYIDIVSFILTQFYLFGMAYQAQENLLGDAAQAVTAAGFFALFALLPVVRHFRLKQHSTPEDIALIIANGACSFIAIIDSAGGWSGGYVGLVCLAFAAVYLLFSYFALLGRSDDDQLANLYLIGMIALVAGALLAEMEREWVAAGWAPLSLLLVFISTRLKRSGPWLCAGILFVGSLFFLAINMPVFTAGPETLWHPFISNWAILSYVVFASAIGWVLLSPKIPETLLSKEAVPSVKNALHFVLIATLFFGVTFEATALDFVVDLRWAAAYIGLALLAMGVFFMTESIVWFGGAFLVQILAFIFIFFLGENSGMRVWESDATRPLMHPWAYLSVISLLATLAMAYIAQIKHDRFTASGLSIGKLMMGVALAQVWVHVSVEITNFSEAYGWTTLSWDRALSAWWVIFGLAVLMMGTLKNRRDLCRAGIVLLAIPFIYNHYSIFEGQDRMIETMLWTAIALGIAIVGSRHKQADLLHGGMVFLAAAAGIDMITHLGDSGASLLRSSWWALAALATMIAGFMEREQNLRRLSIAVFAATAFKLLVFDFSGLETPVRIGASIATGLLMIGASYLYQRFDSMQFGSSSTPR